jgi:hypothetical protein
MDGRLLYDDPVELRPLRCTVHRGSRPLGVKWDLRRLRLPCVLNSSLRWRGLLAGPRRIQAWLEPTFYGSQGCGREDAWPGLQNLLQRWVRAGQRIPYSKEHLWCVHSKE